MCTFATWWLCKKCISDFQISKEWSKDDQSSDHLWHCFNIVSIFFGYCVTIHLLLLLLLPFNMWRLNLPHTYSLAYHSIVWIIINSKQKMSTKIVMSICACMCVCSVVMRDEVVVFTLRELSSKQNETKRNNNSNKIPGSGRIIYKPSKLLLKNCGVCARNFNDDWSGWFEWWTMHI